ncbi:MAG: acylphosphatase [Nitrosopumilaceae archaeon]|jgi:acylphosphatase|uniref:Acylphosphatase n=2 Tax=Candidatus Nitrosomaritimum aestuariumsis TaxID=3342354 RepID=A0AC60VYS6_9ARCH|nr:acylphosphatase [Nitrosopumilaceae archaeon]MBA4452593.1 acylphosphatase [Nitrosopumilaceae archaeon]MBA4461371.1 acylphosphatase [Nitrosopumilaceae archaeon]MBA4463353.1 acylphosphatase [Nitrosopumilaceae archaeon]NCF22304.1 acylphosphatase [Nitrosopumilaceae archaeon]
MVNQRVRVFVKGKVQGVFFRQALKVKAKQNDVFGWVKNLDDGRVEAVLEGNEENVGTLVEWCHGGPANARVEDVDIKNEKFTNEFSKFDVLY